MFEPDRRHVIAYLAAAAVLVVIAARHAGRDGGSNPAPSISIAGPVSAGTRRPRPRARAGPARPLIWVDVAGAVRRPGLYSLPKGARIAASITQAGGFARRANRAAVNRAAKLADGQQVFVPRRGAAGETPALGSAGGAVAGTAAAGPESGAGSISLSTASGSELEQLDGVGPALAQRIIQYREQHGGFHSIQELQEVSGIGPKRFEALKDSITP